MKKFYILIILFAINLNSVWANNNPEQFTIVWKNKTEGRLDITNGDIEKLIANTKGVKIKGTDFRITDKNPRLTVYVSDSRTNPGPEPTVIHVKTKQNPFSFFLRDVNSEYPIYIPQYGVAVLPAGDQRDYEDIARDVESRNNKTKIQIIETEPEASFESVAMETRDMKVPVWLGISRDMRLFEITEELEDAANVEDKIIRPINSSSSFTLPETEPVHLFYRFAVGRGVGAKNNITRRLEDGVLPIYHSITTDDDIIYRSIYFSALESSPLREENVEGTHFLVSDGHSGGRVFTDKQREQLEAELASMPENPEQIVLYSRTEIENTGKVPRYAWIKVPRPGHSTGYSFDHVKGYSSFSGDKIFCVAKLNGEPMPNEETAILLMPGEKTYFEFYLPHYPVNIERADKLYAQDFEIKYSEAKQYWNNKLAKGATINLPDKRLNEMLRAGLLHLDLVTYGKEPSGALAANAGVYPPIATESSPMLQFYASMGWDDIAKRVVRYFIETQQESGKIENFHGYTVETGAALWTLGEYFRYTHDTEWFAAIKDNILKACNFLIEWRDRSKKEELLGRGYGMIDGKVADPEDNFHQFMLNGYGYLGMSRMAEVFEEIGAAEADQLKKEAEDWKKDIQASALNSMALSPVVPLGDGTWSSTLPPWAEGRGPRLLYQEREIFRSHGTFTVADAMLGPIYLVFCEIFEPTDEISRTILRYHSELMYQGNATFSQPYYSKHNWMQARLGMVKPFLNTYFTTMSGHADRETYSFWEHYYRLSPHKTHEEANFLMETRWMLYMEDGDTLKIFPTIPREWMAPGEKIEIKGANSYFGKLDVLASSHPDKGYMEASISCVGDRKPEYIKIRLPHPENKKPINVTGGTYDPQTESLIISNDAATLKVKIDF